MCGSSSSCINQVSGSSFVNNDFINSTCQSWLLFVKGVMLLSRFKLTDFSLPLDMVMTMCHSLSRHSFPFLASHHLSYISLLPLCVSHPFPSFASRWALVNSPLHPREPTLSCVEPTPVANQLGVDGEEGEKAKKEEMEGG